METAVTDHQAFFTIGAMRQIARTTTDKLACFARAGHCPNAVPGT